MSDAKRRAANALPFRKPPEPTGSPARAPARRATAPDLRSVKLEAERLREKLQRSVIDNPQTAKKAALLISLWIEGHAKKARKTG